MAEICSQPRRVFSRALALALQDLMQLLHRFLRGRGGGGPPRGSEREYRNGGTISERERAGRAGRAASGRWAAVVLRISKQSGCELPSMFSCQGQPAGVIRHDIDQLGRTTRKFLFIPYNEPSPGLRKQALLLSVRLVLDVLMVDLMNVLSLRRAPCIEAAMSRARVTIKPA